LVKNIIKGFNKRGLIPVWHSMIPRCYTVIVTLEGLEAFWYFSRSYLLWQETTVHTVSRNNEREPRVIDMWRSWCIVYDYL